MQRYIRETTFAITLALICGFTTSSQAASALYVSPQGNDTNPGTREEPLLSLEGARDAIRHLKKEGALPDGGITVWIGSGTYERKVVFELTVNDSGTENAPIVYRAAKGENVYIAGSGAIGNFRPVTDPDDLERLDEAARGKVLIADFKALGINDIGKQNWSNRGGEPGLELFYKAEPMTLARWPNEGFVEIVDVTGPMSEGRYGKFSKVGKFIYEGDRPKRWSNEKDVWVHGYWFHDWSDQRHKVESIDLENREISVVPPYHSYGYRKGKWFYAFNLLSELDSPGEWYFDREDNRLYFWPPDSAKHIAAGDAVVSLLPTLVSMTDVSHVTFRGITFEAVQGTAIRIQKGSQNRIAGCTLRNIGNWAISVSGGTENGVVGCDITATGSGGISLSGGDRKTLTPAGHFAHNNHIHHYSRWNRMYKPAVAITGVGLRIAHNLIEHAPHEAIAFSGNDHLIEFNEIHSVCFESNDAGAIYSGRDWTKRGTVIRHNYLHHINGFRGRGCVGVYFDDMLSGNTIYGNLFYKVTRAAFVGGGRDCIVENNIFVECKPAMHVDARGLGKSYNYGATTTMPKRLKEMPYQNDLWRKRYPKLTNMLNETPAAPVGTTIVRNISWGGRWDGIRADARPHLTIKDNLIDVDPHFVDADELRFQLRDDSPAFELGFKRIPIEKIGLYQDENRVSWPVAHEPTSATGP